MRTSILIFLLVFTSTVGMTQTNCNCCTESHKQFDFWVGDWDVYDTSGQKIGENKIEKLENNCIVSEKWEGAKGSSGRSYNYFSLVDSTWNQVWIASSGKQLILKGKADTNQMSLRSELIENEKGNYYNRITWTKNEDGSVTQLWEILNTSDQPISTAFEGVYKRKK